MTNPQATTPELIAQTIAQQFRSKTAGFREAAKTQGKRVGPLARAFDAAAAELERGHCNEVINNALERLSRPIGDDVVERATKAVHERRMLGPWTDSDLVRAAMPYFTALSSIPVSTEAAVEAKLRCVIAHATGGGDADTSRSINDICVAISSHHNRIWESALAKGRNEPAEPSGEVVPAEIAELFDLTHELIQEAKGADGDQAYVINHLDDAENWLWKIEDLLRDHRLAFSHPSERAQIVALRDTLGAVRMKAGFARMIHGEDNEVDEVLADIIRTINAAPSTPSDTVGQTDRTEGLQQALQLIAIEAHETIPPDGKSAAFDALKKIGNIAREALTDREKGA